MNNLSTEQTMTVKEISESLGIPIRTVHDNVAVLFPEKVKHGITTHLNELEVTRLKQRLYSHHNSASTRKVAYTELEQDEIIAIAMRLQDEKIKKAKFDLREAEERRDRLIHIGKLYTATEIAKELKYKSAIEFNKKLENKEIQFKINNTWVLTARYAEKGYTSIKELELDNGQIIYDRKWTGLGRDFLLNMDLINEEYLKINLTK